MFEAMNSESDDELFFMDEPRCFYCSQSYGIYVAALLPVIVSACQAVGVFSIVLVQDSAGFGAAAGLLLVQMYEKVFFEICAGFFGFVAIAMPNGSFLKRRMVSLWIMTCIAMSAVYIAHGFAKGGVLAGELFKQDFSKKFGKEGRADWMNQAFGSSSYFSEANRVSSFFLDEAWVKAWAIMVQEILSQVETNPPLYIVILCIFFRYFTAFIFGVVPALGLLVCTGFAVEFAQRECKIVLVPSRRGGFKAA